MEPYTKLLAAAVFCAAGAAYAAETDFDGRDAGAAAIAAPADPPAAADVPRPVPPVRQRTRWRPNTQAYYDGDSFHVVYNGEKYSEPWAGDGYWDAAWAPGRDVAALYDGDDFWVFNARTRRFDSKTAHDGYARARIAAGDALAALYDGDNFLVYDGLKGRFDWYFTDGYERAVLAAGGGIAALYDGDELFIYDREHGKFESEAVDDKYAWFTLSAGKNAVLAYDGDEVFAYCCATRSFSREAAADRAFARAYDEDIDGIPAILVGKDLFTVDPGDCRITRIESGHRRTGKD